MLRSSSPTFLLSILGLSLASFTFACSGASSDNSDVDSSKMAVQKKDGKPTGDGKVCSWNGVTPVAPPPTSPMPPSGGSSGGCAADANGTYRCWSYDGQGNEVPVGSSGGSTGSWSGSSSSGSSGSSSGGCATDDKGNTTCWSSPSEPDAPRNEPPVMPPMPTPPAPDTYELGDWFPSLDGCNRCTCTDIGIMCTVNVCDVPPPPPPGKGCEISGKWLEPGTSYFDGCNTCSCGPDGSVACTARACQDPVPPTPPPTPGYCDVSGKRLEAGASYFDGCNTCTCGKDGQIFCTERACDANLPAPSK